MRRDEEGPLADERLGIGDPLTIDAAKGSVDEAAPHLSFTFVKAPLVEVLQDQHAEDHFGGSAEPATPLAQRIALRERRGDQVDEGFVIERGIDPLKHGVPEFVAVGQQHFKHAALPMGATDHGTSHEVSQPRCVLRGLAVQNITDHGGVAPSRPSTKLRVRVASEHSAPRKYGAPTVISAPERDRKSTRLNSSHGYISYAVFCLKKKKRKPSRPYK